MTAELSVYSHFEWQPGIRRQGDFKRYFRPKREGEIHVMTAFVLTNLVLIHLGIIFS